MAKSNSKAREKSFDLTPEVLIQKFMEQQGKCYYSGMDLVFTPSHLQTLSVERLDNAKGETVANTVLVCHVFNSFVQMTRKKIFYILHHNDQPMGDAEIELNMHRRGVFEQLVHSSKTTDRTRGIDSKLTAEELRQKFADQKGLCAYSGVRMYVGTNIPTFQMSVERVDRAKPHVTSNIVLIIRELNVGGQINLSREIVQEWKQNAKFAETFEIPNLRAEWDVEAVPSTAERICKECKMKKEACEFHSQVEGSFLSLCRDCRNAKDRRKKCSSCHSNRNIKHFLTDSLVCVNCEDPHSLKRKIKEVNADRSPKRRKL